MPNASLEIIERAGHNAHDEEATVVIHIIRRFLGAANRVRLATPAAQL
jgi:pimeloyl-ACP methyl ester carboxylesterase